MVAELVRSRREARGLTQTELADKAGLRQTYVSKLESGEIALPRDHNIEKLGRVLDLTRADFYRAAGVLEGIDVPLAPLPVATLEGDQPFDPQAIVRFVEAHPDEKFRAQLAHRKEIRTPQSYTKLCLRINRAWLSNASLVMEELEEVEQG